MGDVVYCAAFPKSGVTYLDFMLYHALFEPPYDLTRAESHYKLQLEQRVAQDSAAIAEFQQKMATEILRQTKVSEDAYADRDARVASIQSDLDRSVADLARMRRAANAASSL